MADKKVVYQIGIDHESAMQKAKEFEKELQKIGDFHRVNLKEMKIKLQAGIDKEKSLSEIKAYQQEIQGLLDKFKAGSTPFDAAKVRFLNNQLSESNKIVSSFEAVKKKSFDFGEVANKIKKLLNGQMIFSKFFDLGMRGVSAFMGAIDGGIKRAIQNNTQAAASYELLKMNVQGFFDGIGTAFLPLAKGLADAANSLARYVGIVPSVTSETKKVAADTYESWSDIDKALMRYKAGIISTLPHLDLINQKKLTLEAIERDIARGNKTAYERDIAYLNSINEALKLQKNTLNEIKAVSGKSNYEVNSINRDTGLNKFMRDNTALPVQGQSGSFGAAGFKQNIEKVELSADNIKTAIDFISKGIKTINEDTGTWSEQLEKANESMDSIMTGLLSGNIIQAVSGAVSFVGNWINSVINYQEIQAETQAKIASSADDMKSKLKISADEAKRLATMLEMGGDAAKKARKEIDAIERARQRDDAIADAFRAYHDDQIKEMEHKVRMGEASNRDLLELLQYKTRRSFSNGYLASLSPDELRSIEEEIYNLQKEIKAEEDDAIKAQIEKENELLEIEKEKLELIKEQAEVQKQALLGELTLLIKQGIIDIENWNDANNISKRFINAGYSTTETLSNMMELGVGNNILGRVSNKNIAINSVVQNIYDANVNSGLNTAWQQLDKSISG